MATLGDPTISAGTKVDPGVYATYTDPLEQFKISDDASPAKVVEDLKALGREPVWKDWDRAFD